MPKLSKITILLFLCNILRNKPMMKLIFSIQISLKSCYKLMLWFCCGWSAFQNFPKIANLQLLFTISPKTLGNGVHFLQADKFNSFYKLALIFLMEATRQKYRNCFCVLLWCKTFRYFTRVQSCLLLPFFGWLRSERERERERERE